MSTKRTGGRLAGFLAVCLMSLGVALSGPPAIAHEASTDSEETVVINGREFGPEDGLTITTESFEMEPGAGPVGAEYPSDAPAGGIAPLVYWGSSYAYADEILWYWFRGHAYAAANVYGGQRIIQVCFWWTRNNVKVSGETCSTAWSTGSAWRPGLEVGADISDSGGLNDPKTIFNIRTTRINPGIY